MITTPLENLVDAVISNDALTTQEILEKGVNPNGCLDQSEVRPLHFAAQNNALLTVALLVQAGADLSAVTQPDGHTPLDIALLHQHIQMAHVLIALGKTQKMH